MELPSDLISEFVKVTNDKTETKKEVTVYGEVVIEDEQIYVRFDGSDLLTPTATTVEVVAGDRVAVRLKNHTATITGNISSPSARIDTVRLIVGDVEGIQELLVDMVHQDAFDEQVGRIDTLEDQMKTVDLSAIETINNRLDTIETKLNTLENTTIPEIRGLIKDLDDRLTALEG